MYGPTQLELDAPDAFHSRRNWPISILPGEGSFSQTNHLVSLAGLLLASLSCQLLLLFLQEVLSLCSWGHCFHLPFDFQQTGMLFHLRNS